MLYLGVRDFRHERIVFNSPIVSYNNGVIVRGWEYCEIDVYTLIRYTAASLDHINHKWFSSLLEVTRKIPDNSPEFRAKTDEFLETLYRNFVFKSAWNEY